MKLPRRSILVAAICLSTLAMFAIVVPIVRPLHAQSTTPTFTNSNLQGTFAFTEQGFQGEASLGYVGLLTADGAGNISGSAIIQYFNQPNVSTMVSGTYMVASNGTGTMTLTYAIPPVSAESSATSLVARYNFVLTATGAKAARADLGYVTIASFEKQPTLEMPQP